MDKIYSTIGTIVVGLGLIMLGAFITGVFVTFFWNWLMPMLFGLSKIAYIEGWGISVLTGLLFRGTTKVETVNSK
jgi:hypothetical protein